MDNGVFTASLQVTDKDGGVGTDEVMITVNNVAPQNVDAGGNQTITEGSLAKFVAQFSDPGSSDTHVFLWEVVADNGDAVPNGNQSKFFFMPADDGSYAVTLTVTDDDGDSAGDTAILTVLNVAPSIVAITAPDSADEGELLQLTGEVDDPGEQDDPAFLWQVDAYGISGESGYLERAVSLGDAVLGAQANPGGGFYDIRHNGVAHLRFPLTLLAENGIAARFFLRLADAAGERKYRQAALWALGAFTGDFTPYGVYASAYGCALGAYMSLPVQVAPPR